MKHTAFIMAILLTFSLTACSMNGKNSGSSSNNNNTTTSPSNTGSTVKPGTDNGLDIVNGSSGLGGGINNNAGDNNGSADNDPDDNKVTLPDTGKDNGINNGGAVSPNANERRFMYAGKNYTVTDEKVPRDKVGAELYSILSMVDEGLDLSEDGDAIGLDEGVRIFKLVEENEYREVAVEIDGEYYLARVDGAENTDK